MVAFVRGKWFLFLAVVLLVPVSLVLASCTGSEGPEGPAGEQGPQGEPAAATVFTLKLDSNEPGCGGVCHEALAPHIQPPTGAYTLAYEANHAWEGHGFDALGELLTLNDCLQCHAVGTGDRAGEGNVASKALRDIVHRVHLTSEHFQIELDGE